MAKISLKDWENYRKQLYQLSSAAGNKFTAFLESQPKSWNMTLEQEQAALDYAYALITKYGEGTGALAAEMYDATARLQKAVVPPADIAQTASYSDVAKAIKGATKTSTDSKYLGGVVSRMVKQAGADTTLRNAVRDGAEFAWIPNGGETCAFCIMLASNGWLKASKKAVRNGHAPHIHANCDCTYAIRFDSRTRVEGYDPEYYERMYYNAKDRVDEGGAFWSGKSDKDAINQIRRDKYKLNAEKIRAQHRAAYAKRQSGGKTIGGHRYIENEYDKEKEKIAIRKYEQYARVDDSAIIAKNTGFSREEIQQVRSHVFFKKHDLERGYERLAPDYDMAVAWKRLQDGNYLPRDITLLNHELLESNYESAYNISQAEAHNMAQKQYNWFKQMMNETNQKGEADGLL